jgi:hypothetical protein
VLGALSVAPAPDEPRSADALVRDPEVDLGAAPPSESLGRAAVRCVFDADVEPWRAYECLLLADRIAPALATNAALAIEPGDAAGNSLGDLLAALRWEHEGGPLAAHLDALALLTGTPPSAARFARPRTAVDHLVARGRGYRYTEEAALPDDHATLARTAAWLLRPVLDDAVFEEIRLDPGDPSGPSDVVGYLDGLSFTVRAAPGDYYDAAATVGLVNALAVRRAATPRVGIVAGDPPYVTLVAGAPDALRALRDADLLVLAAPPPVSE